jgi:hypothetical protein
MVIIMKGLESISPIGLTLLSIVIALIIIANFDSDELNVIGNTLIGIGGIMIITATQSDFINGISDKCFEEELLKAKLANLQKRKNNRGIPFPFGNKQGIAKK